MVAPYANATQRNANKCPHGLPVGTCPICSGMGGGGKIKDKNKARNPGEMSYNECMAAWIKIQAAKEAKLEAEISRMNNIQKLLLEQISKEIEKMQKFLDKLSASINNLPAILKVPLKIVVAVLSLVPTIINAIQKAANNIKNFIHSMSEKMAMILGEIKNFINSAVVQKFGKALKTVLAFFSQKEEEENEEVEKLKSREIKKIIKSLFRIKNKDEEKEENKENNKEEN